MLHMEAESEVIQKLRCQVDNWDEQQELLENPEEPLEKMDATHQHVQLCAPATLHSTISAYSVTLHQEHGITDFLESLSSFLERHSLDPDIHSYKVSLSLRLFFLILINQITPYHSCRVTYDCQETGSKKTDLFRATDHWRNGGPRYDCVLVQGWPTSRVFFARVLGLFSVSHHNQIHSLAILRPFVRKYRNKLTGFLQLEEMQEQYEFCFINSFIRAVHILPPSHVNKWSILQDLVDGDAYLRFISIK